MMDQAKRALESARKFQIAADEVLGTEPSIEKLAHQLWMKIDGYADDKAWDEEGDDSYPGDVWVGLILEGRTFYVGWGGDDCANEPFASDTTIRGAIELALQEIDDFHKRVTKDKAQLAEDAASQEGDDAAV